MRLFVPFTEGFEEIEAFAIIDILRRARIKVDMVGVPGMMITGAHDIRVTMDKKLAEVNVNEYDGIILPGGSLGCTNLAKTASLLEMIKQLDSRRKLIGAICAAPTVLVKAGVLEDRRATIYPGMENELPYPRADRVVVDNNIITSQAPGTAIEFALKIVEVLLGKQKSQEIREDLVV